MAEILKTLNQKEYKITKMGETKPDIKIGGLNSSLDNKISSSMRMGFDFETGVEQYFIEVSRSDKVTNDEQETFVDGKLKLKIGLDTDIWHIEGDKLKWDIEFDVIPKKNEFEWNIDFSPGLEFIYQPELTEAEIEKGTKRPENVVGSYVVYCNRKHHLKDSGGRTVSNYKTGKVCHIYRPLCIDANGREAWADLRISNNSLKITIPKEYLDVAVAPLILDPTFGYESIGGSTDYWSPAQASHAETTPVSNGTLDSITLHGQSEDASTTGLAVALYSDSAGPSARLATEESTVGTIPVNGAPDWTTTALSVAVTASTQYWLAFNNVVGSRIWYSFDAGTDEFEVAGEDAFTDPWTAASNYGHIVSIYGTYTAAGGGIVGSIMALNGIHSPIFGGQIIN